MLSFSIKIEPSRLLNAGNGVILSGQITKHQLVSFYPGFYTPPPPLHAIINASGETCIKGGEVISGDSIYKISCPTVGGSIDATDYSRPSFPYAVGDIINHPPQGVKPNVFPVDFAWAEVLKASESWRPESRQRLHQYMKHMNQFANGLWYIDPNTFEPIYVSACQDKHPRAGIVIVSLTDIEDNQELLMDYRFNRAGPLPPWYKPVDE